MLEVDAHGRSSSATAPSGSPRRCTEQAPAWANVTFVEQTEQRGTGDAAMRRHDARSPATTSTTTRPSSCCPATRRCCGPRRSTSWSSTHVANGNAATLLTSVLDDPTGYGRVVRGAATGGCCASSSSATPRPTSSTIKRGQHQHLRVPARPARARRCATSPPTTRRASTTSPTWSACWPAWATGSARCRRRAGETQGVNDRWQLALAERELRARTNRHWLLNGVTMLDPRQTFIDVTVQLGRDVTLYPGTILQGDTVDRRRLRDRPRHPARSTAWSAPSCVDRAHGRPRRRGRRRARSVGPFAHLPPGSVGRCRTRSTGAFYTASYAT